MSVPLIGRSVEIEILNRFLAQSSNGTMVLHGLPSAGKSFLLRKWLEPTYSKTGRKSLYVVRNVFASAQDFVKGLARKLFLDCNPEEQNLLLMILAKELGADFSISEWFRQSRQHYLKDGYIFLQFLKALRQSNEIGILLVLDQAENLCAEGRDLLRHLSEWKPVGVNMVLSLSTKSPGKEGVTENYGIDFYFKGTQFMEILPLQEQWSETYLNTYHVGEVHSEFHFMEYGMFQKRAWLVEQLSNNADLRRLFCFLAHFPFGIPHSINPYLESFREAITQNPLFLEILSFDSVDLCFTSTVYIFDMGEHFPQDYAKSIRPVEAKEAEDWVIHQDFHLSIVYQGVPGNELLIELLELYAKTNTISLLRDCLSVFESTEGGTVPEQYQIWRDLEQLYFHFDEPKSKNFFDHWLLKPGFTPSQEMLSLLASILKRNKAFILMAQAPLPLLLYKSELLSRLFWPLAQQGDGKEASHVLCHESLPNPVQLSGKAVLDFFRSGLSLPKEASLAKDYPALYNLAKAIEAHESGQSEHALSLLENAYRIALKTSDFDSLAPILSRCADVYNSLNDYDAQLKAYREAVVASIFTP